MTDSYPGMPYESSAEYLLRRTERHLLTAHAKEAALTAQLAHRTQQRDNLSQEVAIAVEQGRRYFQFLIQAREREQHLEDRLLKVGVILRTVGPDSAKVAQIDQLLNPERFKDE